MTTAEEIMNTEVSPFYLRKIKTFFNCKNQHIKGIMTKVDFELQADRYKKLANLNTLREQQTRRKLLRVWDDFFGEISKIAPVTPELFAKCVAVKDRDYLICKCTHYADVIFDLIDLNADGMISPNEFVLFHKLYLLNEETADAAFKFLDKENKGYVDYDTFVAAVTDFFLPVENPTVLWGPLAD